MTVPRIFTWGITFPWPPSWPLFRFWQAAGNVPAELAKNERALQQAAARLEAIRKAPPP